MRFLPDWAGIYAVLGFRFGEKCLSFLTIGTFARAEWLTIVY